MEVKEDWIKPHVGKVELGAYIQPDPPEKSEHFFKQDERLLDEWFELQDVKAKLLIHDLEQEILNIQRRVARLKWQLTPSVILQAAPICVRPTASKKKTKKKNNAKTK